MLPPTPCSLKEVAKWIVNWQYAYDDNGYIAAHRQKRGKHHLFCLRIYCPFVPSPLLLIFTCLPGNLLAPNLSLPSLTHYISWSSEAQGQAVKSQMFHTWMQRTLIVLNWIKRSDIFSLRNHYLQYIGHAKKLKSHCQDAINSEQNIPRFLHSFSASC